MKNIIIILILLQNIYSYDKLYFLPKDNKEAKKSIISLIKNAKNSIDLAIYNISYNKFIKELNKKSKEGVEINIFNYKKDNKFHKNIKFYKTKDKMHTKIAIFDKKVVVFGSANWKKNAFTKNYEVVNITNEEEKVKKFNNFFIELKEKN